MAKIFKPFLGSPLERFSYFSEIPSSYAKVFLIFELLNNNLKNGRK